MDKAYHGRMLARKRCIYSVKNTSGYLGSHGQIIILYYPGVNVLVSITMSEKTKKYYGVSFRETEKYSYL